jgi:hypothetical protein
MNRFVKPRHFNVELQNFSGEGKLLAKVLSSLYPSLPR